jgi:CheY-like chemotaxis protein
VPVRVLVVDDDAAIRFAMERYFRARGYDTHSAGSADEAARWIRSHSVDVLIADLRLTGFDGVEGLELAKLVRETSPHSRTILLTAYRSPILDEQARPAGVDVVVQKPQRLSALAEVVDQLLAGRQ